MLVSYKDGVRVPDLQWNLKISNSPRGAGECCAHAGLLAPGLEGKRVPDMVLVFSGVTNAHFGEKCLL